MNAAAMGGNSIMVIVFIIIMVVMMYFTSVRGPKKQQEKRQQMYSGLKKGDAIVTVGGLHGVIDSVNIKKGTVVLDANGVFLTFALQAVGQVTHKAEKTTVAVKHATSEEAQAEVVKADDTKADEAKADDAKAEDAK
jgi:preprotein translocase subunit YajC